MRIDFIAERKRRDANVSGRERIAKRKARLNRAGESLAQADDGSVRRWARVNPDDTLRAVNNAEYVRL